MFICQNCKKSTKKQYTLVIKKRTKQYHYYLIQCKGRYMRKRFITEDKEIANNPDYKVLKEQKIKGWEIAKVLNLCSKCYELKKEG